MQLGAVIDKVKVAARETTPSLAWSTKEQDAKCSEAPPQRKQPEPALASKQE
jgi:hypothetical protein